MTKSNPIKKPTFNPETLHPDDSLGTSFREWFVDYASYVATDRALPHLKDGLKPVQRRILFVMHTMEDGRYNKNASIIGETTKYHPHGDASIRDALVQLGQKELAIDTQGNWGNIHTGHGAAAPRYIEARLTAFAKETVFNNHLTDWGVTYDGRKREPIALPTKFPLLLAQGAEGIGVGLACRILPHNFNEIIDAMVSALRGRKFTLLPDFPTGGIADASNYNDGQSGGRVLVRAHIEAGPASQGKVLYIRSVPFGTNTASLKESILAAHDKGKIKVQHLEDKTAAEVCLVLKLPSDADIEASKAALFAFTKCEQSLAVHACVLDESQPRFVSITELVTRAAAQTQELFQKELELALSSKQEQRLYLTLEKIFIENRIYRRLEKCETEEAMSKTIRSAMRPHTKEFLDKLSDEIVHKLLQIQVRRISKYDAKKTDTQIAKLSEEITELEAKLADILNFTVNYLKGLKKRYGKDFPRLTTLDSFERVSVQEAALSNLTLYLDRQHGFAGTGLKGEVEELCNCSEVDSVLSIRRDGNLSVSRVGEKVYVGTDPLCCQLYDRDDKTIHSLIYQDGDTGHVYLKRFQVGGVTRDRDYPLASPNTKVLWYGAQEPDAPAPKLVVHLKPAPRQKKTQEEVDLNDFAVKGRSARGNRISKYEAKRVQIL